MDFDLQKSYEIWERTPKVLQTLLAGIDPAWTTANEGADTWSPYDVVGHLIHGEKTDWLVRINLILEEGTKKSFEPFDRFAQFEESKGKTLETLLVEFELARNENLRKLKMISNLENLLDKKGTHPTFGEVTLRQLLATYTIHDLSHIAQITRVMAKQYKTEMGPWIEYFNLLQ